MPPVVGKGWSKLSGGWNGGCQCSGYGMYRWEMSRVVCVSEGVCGIQQRMYQELVIRDGGTREIAGISV